MLLARLPASMRILLFVGRQNRVMVFAHYKSRALGKESQLTQGALPILQNVEAKDQTIKVLAWKERVAPLRCCSGTAELA